MGYRTFDDMPQRNSHRRNTDMTRRTTIPGLLSLRGTLLTVLVLVLLITNGGAG
jgi:hypothetical protein